MNVVHQTHRAGLLRRDAWLRLLAGAGFDPDAIIERTAEERAPRELFVGRRPPVGRTGSDGQPMP